MNRTFVILIFAALTLIATGCGYKKAALAPAPLTEPMVLTAFAGVATTLHRGAPQA
jgi:hypothetical protein